MKIVQLKPSQRVQGRWLVQLEDGTLLRVGENEVLSFSLYTGKELTGEELQAMQQAARKSGLKEKALNLAASKPISRRELERKLESWEATEEETAQICDRLEELGLLDDARYACTVVRHYSGKGYGLRKLQDELYRRGVPQELWEQALEEVQDPTDAIEAFVAKKLAGKEPDRRELKRVSDALLRRGYQWQEIRPVLDRYRRDDLD